MRGTSADSWKSLERGRGRNMCWHPAGMQPNGRTTSTENDLIQVKCRLFQTSKMINRGWRSLMWSSYQEALPLFAHQPNESVRLPSRLSLAGILSSLAAFSSIGHQGATYVDKETIRGVSSVFASVNSALTCSVGVHPPSSHALR